MLLFQPAPAFATTIVAAGYDLFTTPSASFGGVPFVGEPIGTYDFGPSGTWTVGNTDTIVQRHAAASVGSMPATAAPISIELVALRLKSTIPVDMGLGLGIYYITLQSERGGPASLGEMTIDFEHEPLPEPHGRFDSFFDVFFDIRLGSASGPIAFSDGLRLSSSRVPWSHEPVGGTLIDGVNHLLDGSSILQDFWPTGFEEVHPTGAMHAVQPSSGGGAKVQDGGNVLALLGIPFGLLAWQGARSGRKAACVARP